MEFLLLGPFEVRDAELVLELGGVRQRAVLAYLALHANEVVAVDRLVEELWTDRPPASAAKVVQNAVVRLREAVGDRLVTRSPGYVLRIEPGELDIERFDSLVEEARRADAAAAARKLRDALQLWRGGALADLAYEPFAQTDIARLEELRAAAVEDRIDADLALGRHAELVGELEALVAANPLRERLRAQWMLALYRSGRQAEALEVYRRGRQLLVDELGLEPGPALQRLEKAILVQDPSLEPPPPLQPETVPDLTPPGPRPRRIALIGAALALAGAAALAAALEAGSGGAHSIAPNSVAILDPASGRVIGSSPVGVRPGPVASGAGGVWIANAGDATVSRLAPRTGRTVRTIALGEPATSLAVGAGSLWVAAGSGVVRRIDPAFDAVVQTIHRRRYPFEFDESLNAASPIAFGEGSIWFGNSSTVTRIDPRAGQAVGTVGVGFSPSGSAVGDGAVWVADSVDDTVTRIDRSGATTPIQVGHGASAVAVGDGVWVADTRDDAVVRIDPRTDAVTTTVAVGRSPSGLAIGRGFLWVANSGSGTVSRVDLSAARVTKTISIGGSPSGLALAADRLWVSVADRVPARSEVAGGSARFNAPGDPDSIDPAIASDEAAVQLEFATCVKLLNYPDAPAPTGSRLIGEAAAEPAISADGRVYSFRIKPGFRFSPPSNRPVTAQTFLYTIQRARRLSPDAAELLSDVRAITALGDTLTLRLADPQPSLPARLASPQFCAVPENTPLAPQRAQPIPSAGPYYIASYVPKQRLVLRRNPNYRGARPHRFEEIDYTLGVDPARTVAEIEAGRADYAVPSFITGAVPAPSVRSLVRRYGPSTGRRQQFYENPTLEEVWLALNPNRAPFSNELLRRAVAYAVDRPARSHDADYAFGSDDHLLPPALPAYENVHLYPLRRPDLRTARRLAEGRRSVALMYTCDGCSVQLVQDELAKIGLDVVVRAYPAAEMLRRVKTPGEPVDLYVGGTIASYADPSAFLNDVLIGRYVAALAPHDPTVVRRLEAAGRLVGAARDRAYGKLDLLLARAAYLVPLGPGLSEDFFSRRIGCEVYQPIYGMDIGALCLR